MTDSASRAKPAASPSSRWALAPVGLLACSVVGLSWMAIVAASDPNFALEPNYYQKAIHWDQTQAQAADNQRLGYQFSLPKRVPLDAHGHASVVVRILDRAGQPVTGARLVAEAFPNAYSDRISQLSFSEREPGSYVAEVVAGRAGLWELRLSMNDGPEHATAIVRADFVAGGAA